MIRHKTVIIVGAGASNEVGLPVGEDLKDIIRKLLDISFEDYTHQNSGDSQIVNAFKAAARLDTSLENNPHDINPYINAACRIARAMPQAISIDNYIDNHAGDKLIELSGKIAVVRSILEAESNSKLFINTRARETQINFHNIRKTWFTS